MKKNKYVAFKCHAHHCGNFCRSYKNNCRALIGLVPANFFDCYAFMTAEQAAKLDAQIADEEKKRKEGKK